MLRFFLLAFVAIILGSCQSGKTRSGFEDIADFGLSDEPMGSVVDDKAYFDDLKRSESSISFESSLPLPFSVGKMADPFDSVPPQARVRAESRLLFQVGPCHFSIVSGPIQVDRYLLAGDWIKLTEGLPAKVSVKLESNMDLNVKIVSKLAVEIPDAPLLACRRIFEGKKIFLGRFHLNKSRIGLIPAPSSPKVQFGSRSLEPRGKMVFLRWQKGTNVPIVIDDFDFPATAESGIFRAQMGGKGFYYLAVQSVLRKDQVDQIVIKLPYPLSRPKGNGKAKPSSNERE